MKIKMRTLRLNGVHDKDTKKEIKNVALEKFLFHTDKTMMRQILKYIQNDLTTEQVQKFISIKDFKKVFKDKAYQCTVGFHFSMYGDLSIEIIDFCKRDMYKEMKGSQQRLVNINEGVVKDDNFLF